MRLIRTALRVGDVELEPNDAADTNAGVWIEGVIRTPQEARDLAALLLEHAEAADPS